MQASKETIYPHAQCLSRGLFVLRALNAATGGDATAREISEQTKLNRSTVKRILETLVTDGYVRPCSASGSYSLSPEVDALSRGLSGDSGLLEHASTVMRDIALATRWSMRITTVRADRMLVRDTTHAASALASEFTVGLRHGVPILLTAAGRAYLASCSDAERVRVVDAARASQTEQTPLARNPRLIELMVRRVADDGYSTNDGDWGGGRAGAVALPIRNPGGKTIACISMLYPRPGMNRSTLERECVPALRGGVARIEALTS